MLTVCFLVVYISILALIFESLIFTVPLSPVAYTQYLLNVKSNVSIFNVPLFSTKLETLFIIVPLCSLLLSLIVNVPLFINGCVVVNCLLFMSNVIFLPSGIIPSSVNSASLITTIVPSFSIYSTASSKELNSSVPTLKKVSFGSR